MNELIVDNGFDGCSEDTLPLSNNFKSYSKNEQNINKQQTIRTNKNYP
jgi:hypothetical protein